MFCKVGSTVHFVRIYSTFGPTTGPTLGQSGPTVRDSKVPCSGLYCPDSRANHRVLLNNFVSLSESRFKSGPWLAWRSGSSLTAEVGCQRWQKQSGLNSHMGVLRSLLGFYLKTLAIFVVKLPLSLLKHTTFILATLCLYKVKIH